jgi:hypothetical protein
MLRIFVVIALALIASGQAYSGQAYKDPSDPGTRVIVYEVDGSVHSAFLTYRDADGKTKQKHVELPYKEQFFAPYGGFVYISAQKRVFKKRDDSMINPRDMIIDDGRQGTLHVMIRVGGVPFKQAETDEPFGIATVKGEVPAR